MAAPRIFSLSRTLLTKQTLASFLLPRPFSSTTATTTFSLLRLRPLSTLTSSFTHRASSTPFSRTFSTRQGQSSLNDNSPNWSNRPPKETILLDGCDFEHWLVVTEPPPEGATRDEIIDSYIRTLAQIVGSEEEARMKIYSVSTRCYYAFGALVSEELSYKLKELPNVRWVLPDSYLDVKNKDYGGEPFINGQAVPYDPKYHEEWIRNNQKAQERNRRNDRPRNADRSRNFDRRQRNTGFQNHPNMGGPGGNAGGPPNMVGMPNQPSGNMGGPGYNSGGPPNMGGMPNQPPRGPPNMPPNNPGYGPNNPGYGQQQNNPGYAQHMPPNNSGFGNAPNQGGMPPPNYGVQGNPGYQQGGGSQGNPGYQQGGGMPYQNQQNYAPQGNMGGQPGGGYQGQDVPGRDMPQYQ